MSCRGMFSAGELTVTRRTGGMRRGMEGEDLGSRPLWDTSGPGSGPRTHEGPGLVLKLKRVWDFFYCGKIHII